MTNTRQWDRSAALNPTGPIIGFCVPFNLRVDPFRKVLKWLGISSSVQIYAL